MLELGGLTERILQISSREVKVGVIFGSTVLAKKTAASTSWLKIGDTAVDFRFWLRRNECNEIAVYIVR